MPENSIREDAIRVVRTAADEVGCKQIMNDLMRLAGLTITQARDAQQIIAKRLRERADGIADEAEKRYG